MNSTIWIILAVVAAILLIIYFRSKNAVWGGLTYGIIIGAIVAIVLGVMGKGFQWLMIGKIAIVGVILGFLAELLPKIPRLLGKKQ